MSTIRNASLFHMPAPNQSAPSEERCRSGRGAMGR